MHPFVFATNPNPVNLKTLNRFAQAAVFIVFGLIFVGGLVTSWQAGMAVPDWPLSFGSLNPEGWWANFPVRLEHGHRLLGALVGLDRDDLFKKISKYSGGMRRKLEIARSLLHRPQVLFLDEPTVGLDPESRRSVAGYLDAIRRSEKTTMVLTTHYLDEVEIADQVCIIDRGKIVANGTPAELRTGTGVTRVEFEAADRIALSAEVEKLGHTPQPISAGVAVEVLGAEAAHALVRDLKTPLTRFEVRSPSLEDAYLKIVAATADDREESPLDDAPRRSFRR